MAETRSRSRSHRAGVTPLVLLGTGAAVLAGLAVLLEGGGPLAAVGAYALAGSFVLLAAPLIETLRTTGRAARSGRLVILRGF